MNTSQRTHTGHGVNNELLAVHRWSRSGRTEFPHFVERTRGSPESH